MADNLFTMTPYSQWLLPEIKWDMLYKSGEVQQARGEKAEQKYSDFVSVYDNIDLHEKYNDSYNEWKMQTDTQVDELINRYGGKMGVPEFSRDLNKLISQKKTDPWIRNAMQSSKNAKLYEEKVLQNPDIKPYNDPNALEYGAWLEDAKPDFKYKGFYADAPPENWFTKKVTAMPPEKRTQFSKYGEHGFQTTQIESKEAAELTKNFNELKTEFKNTPEGMQLQRMVDSGHYGEGATFDEAYNAYMKATVEQAEYVNSTSTVTEDTDGKVQRDLQQKAIENKRAQAALNLQARNVKVNEGQLEIQQAQEGRAQEVFDAYKQAGQLTQMNATGTGLKSTSSGTGQTPNKLHDSIGDALKANPAEITKVQQGKVGTIYVQTLSDDKVFLESVARDITLSGQPGYLIKGDNVTEIKGISSGIFSDKDIDIKPTGNVKMLYRGNELGMFVELASPLKSKKALLEDLEFAEVENPEQFIREVNGKYQVAFYGISPEVSKYMQNTFGTTMAAPSTTTQDTTSVVKDTTSVQAKELSPEQKEENRIIGANKFFEASYQEINGKHYRYIKGLDKKNPEKYESIPILLKFDDVDGIATFKYDPITGQEEIRIKHYGENYEDEVHTYTMNPDGTSNPLGPQPERGDMIEYIEEASKRYLEENKMKEKSTQNTTTTPTDTTKTPDKTTEYKSVIKQSNGRLTVFEVKGFNILEGPRSATFNGKPVIVSIDRSGEVDAVVITPKDNPNGAKKMLITDEKFINFSNLIK